VVAPEPTSTTATTSTTTAAPAAPTAVADDATIEPGESIVIDVLANDQHPDAAFDHSSLRIVSSPRFGSAEVTATGRITYVAGDTFPGSDEFAYEVCDILGLCTRALVTVRSATVPPCSADDVRVESFVVDPSEGPPGSTSQVVLRIDADECAIPGLLLQWSGAPWGNTAVFSDGVVRVERAVPETATEGTHHISARFVDGEAVLATFDFTVGAGGPVAPPPASGGGIPWPWLSLGIAAVGGGAATLAWRRRHTPLRLRAMADAAAGRAEALADRARALDADLDACEGRRGRRFGALPTGAWVDEKPGGTEPYLLEFENPYAPPQDDGHRGWYHPRRKEPIRGIVVHTTDGLALPNMPADNVARYFATCRTAASAHAVIDGRGVITLLPDHYTALHMPLANSASLGLVVCLLEDKDEQRRALAHAARWCRVKAADHEIPFERVDAAAWRIGGYGIIGHADLDPAAPDPAAPGGTRFPWKALLDPDGGPSKFLGLVPVKRKTTGDPCAAIRRDAARAHEAASKAARRAARFGRRLGG
jgi:hypothetical protein